MAYELFVDGFDYYDTADIPKKWPLGAGASNVISAGTGRRGTDSLYVDGGSVGRSTTLSTKGVIGCAIKPIFNNRVLFTVGLATTHLRLIITADWKIAVYRTGVVFGEEVLLATSTNVLDYTAWNYIEFGFFIDNAGSIEVRVNGSSVGWIPTLNVDTREATLASNFDNIYVGYSAGSGSLVSYIDDLYMTYGDEIKFFGDSRVDTLTLTADSTPQDWTPDSGNAWERLNGTGYVSATTVGASSLFAAADLSVSPSVIHGVQIDAHIKKSDAGAKSAATLVKSGATTTAGSDLALSTDQLLARSAYIVNPTTSTAWNKSDVDNMTIGVRVTA